MVSQRCFSHSNNLSRLEVAKTKNGRNDTLGRHKREISSMFNALVPVGKGTYSNFILKVPGAKEQLSKVNDMLP